MAPAKPRHRSGYSREETLQVEAACLTAAITLGALLDDLRIVGGLVPTLLIDRNPDLGDDHSEEHPGTLDLDVGLAIGLLDEGQYAAVSERLRQEHFRAGKNDNGNPTLQCWEHEDLDVTMDFLLAPIPGDESGRRIHPLEHDFGAVITPGLELAFDEFVEVTIDGHALSGERAIRAVPVCGPAAFVVLKALAFEGRGEPKDAFDLVYTIRNWPGGVQEIAERLARHAERHAGYVNDALTILERDFRTPEMVGSLRVAEFEEVAAAARDEVAADASGYVDDLLRVCRTEGLTATARQAA